jgi:hypothetical protein
VIVRSLETPVTYPRTLLGMETGDSHMFRTTWMLKVLVQGLWSCTEIPELRNAIGNIRNS